MKQYVIADDLTGASDAGVHYAKRGVRAVVWLDYERPRGCDETEADVIVFDTDSRAEQPATAYARLSAMLEGLGPLRPSQVVKKVDSTMRGNAGAEIRALLDALPNAFAVVCPAYPKNGRTSRDGMLYVHGVRVDATDFGRDLFSPVRDARIGAHIETPFASFDLQTVRAGSTALSAAVDAARAAGLRSAVVDAETDEDLRIVARLASMHDDLLWAGSAGVIEMLQSDATTAPCDVPPAAGPVLFLIGSLSEMTQQQIAAFSKTAPSVRLDPMELLAGHPEKEISSIARWLARGSDAMIALQGDRAAVEAALAFGCGRGWDRRVTSMHLRRTFIEVASAVIGAHTDMTVVLSGGDVARSFCDAHAIPGFELLAETAPGIPLSRAVGSQMKIVTKAGGFGRPETYSDIVTALHREVTA